MKIRPLHDKVIVRRIEENKTTASGIIIPDSATAKPSRAKVIAVGKGKKNDNGDIIKMDVKVGDNILFTEYSGSEISVDGEKLLVMREEDITAIIE